MIGTFDDHSNAARGQAPLAPNWGLHTESAHTRLHRVSRWVANSDPMTGTLPSYATIYLFRFV